MRHPVIESESRPEEVTHATNASRSAQVNHGWIASLAKDDDRTIYASHTTHGTLLLNASR